MQLRIDRAGLLLDELHATIGFSKARLEDITDDEFLWEPAPGAWSLRRRVEARTALAYGPGQFVLDNERPEPSPAPATTTAWRIAHLQSGLAGHFEWTFGTSSKDPASLVDFSPSSSVARPALWAADDWRAAIESTSDEDLDQVGFGQYPHGLDPQIPFIAIVWWTNRELTHHLAEAALLRDLWQHLGRS